MMVYGTNCFRSCQLNSTSAKYHKYNYKFELVNCLLATFKIIHVQDKNNNNNIYIIKKMFRRNISL